MNTSLDLDGPAYADKLHGCWLGKNAGGTLGTPVEEAFGRPEPFDLTWYPELRDGGLPNDDLEIQLAWLKALEEVGPGLTARDLSRYWLDHVGYNFDEYGLSKTNLRRGLEPPVSGWFDNWFVDCMGCPIRAEIWACVAPGAPRVAARYAYQDAICDHAGGESVYGELFDVALESAAFVFDDTPSSRRRLVEIGLTYVPSDSRTAMAIRAAVQAYDAGVDWRVARQRVLEATPHLVAQYSPINLGFQVIGLLYGEDFGDGICTTVNCGYDTDSSGASIGSYLGILAGRSGLPARWIEPLGDTIATNESWGGVRHLSDGPNPIPHTLDDLVARIRRVAGSVLAAHGLLDETGHRIAVRADELEADESVRSLWDASPTIVTYAWPDLSVALDYAPASSSDGPDGSGSGSGSGSASGSDDEARGPVAVPGRPTRLATTVRNPRAVPVTVTLALEVPDGWTAPPPRTIEVEPGERARLDWVVDVPARRFVAGSNRLFLRATPHGRPALPSVPVVLVGARAWEVRRVDSAGSGIEPWRALPSAGNAVGLSQAYHSVDPAGGLEARAYLEVPDDAGAREVLIAVEASGPMTLTVDGVRLAAAEPGPTLRPNYGGRPGANATLELAPGWHELLVGLKPGPGGATPDCHVLLCTADRFRDGIVDIGWTRHPTDL